MHGHHIALNAVPAGHPGERRSRVYQAVAKPVGRCAQSALDAVVDEGCEGRLADTHVLKLDRLREALE
jgi:hypothetical protein